MQKRLSTIAFSTPDYVDEAHIDAEIATLCRLLRADAVDFIHLRKPGASEDEMASILERVPGTFLRSAVLHSHFQLASRYDIGGFHLNSRCPEADESLLYGPTGLRRRISRSMHSLEELESYLEEEKSDASARYTYVTLSPIFDSISKSGYGAAFNTESESLRDNLKSLLERMIAAETPVIALGGVTPQRFRQIAEAGFGGAAMLGYIWERGSGSIEDIEQNIIENRYVTVYH